MTVKKNLEFNEVIYFITFSCFQWISLFDIVGYDIAYTWFRKLQQSGIKLNGFVIMPNHLHVMLYLPKSSVVINKIIGNGKRFMAYEMVSRLKISKKEKILSRLRDGVSPADSKSGKIHKVFNTSFDAKICYTREFAEQKLNYIHHNPVSGKWNFVGDFSTYKHSSASFYELNKNMDIPITHYMDLL